MKVILIDLFIKLVVMAVYRIKPIIVSHMTVLINKAETVDSEGASKKDWVLKELRQMGGEIGDALIGVSGRGLNLLLEVLVTKYFPPVK